MWHTQHWVGQRGNNRHLSHVAAAPKSYHWHTSLSFAAPQDRWENKVLDVNEALTFTVINSRNTKLFQHNRWICGGATPTENRGGYILAHSTDLHQVLCQIEMLQLCGMHETMIQAHVGAIMSNERTKCEWYVADLHGHMTLPWLCGHGKAVNLQEISSWHTGK